MAHLDLGVRTQGRKRPAANDPDDQPLTKKFGRLRLGALPNCNGLEDENVPSAVPEASSSSDSMLLDDTEHTTYIHDLDRELKEIETQEGCIAFLPDIEKQLVAIPKSLLTDPKPENNELVLYHVPTSLTVPKEQDNVRKAIIESRARAREKQAEIQRRNSTEIPCNLATDVLSGVSSTEDAARDAAETMDIDCE